MRLFVRHDGTGRIISAIKAHVLPEGLVHPYGALAEGEHVLEVESTAELQALDCLEIVERHAVDVAEKRLRPRADVEPAPPRRRRKGAR